MSLPRSTPALSALLTVPRSAQLYGRSAIRAETWATFTIILVVSALILYVMAVPRTRLTRGELAHQRTTVELRLALNELRAMIGDYRADHGIYPGWIPGTKRGSSDPRADEECFTEQLVLASNVAGELGEEGWSAFPLGPYAPEGLPKNPVNDLASVHVLGPRENFPASATNSTGWIYQARTGTIRANSPGRAFALPCPYIDL